MSPTTRECEWLRFLENVPQWLPPKRPTVVIAPHPDDETLGAGGLIAIQRRKDVPVIIIAVTDGEAAYSDAIHLDEIRRAEQESAVGELGVECTEIRRLGLSDGKVTAFEDKLVDLVRPSMRPGTLLVAPWSGDPHPDHEACGRAAERLAKEPDSDISLISYLFWTWHRNRVESLATLPLRRLKLDAQIQAARSAALSEHRSQLEWEMGSPVLPESLLYPARRPFETFIIHG
ncbi:MAG: PIG-L family deacetylase [Bryobacterales bacterium]|nr:PIG-L family deacetylase [Bryobacterales bacterium]